jgi:ABC-type multidrug transport system fused ATPase/permease subunit
MAIGAVFETLGIGLIIPLINMMLSPEIINEQSVLNYVYHFFNFPSTGSFFIFSCFVLLAVFITKNVYLYFVNVYQYRLLLNEQTNLSIKLLAAYLNKPYVFHLQRNSSELLRNINSEISVMFSGIMLPLCTLVSELLIVIFIIMLLIFVEPYATFIAALFLIVSSALFSKVFKKKLERTGLERQYYGGQMIKWINQSLGAVKEIKIAGKEQYFINTFTTNAEGFKESAIFNQILNQLPRQVIETIAVGAILLIIIGVLLQGENIQKLLPILGIFSMAAFRLMPSFNRIIGATTAIRSYQPSVDVIYNDLIDADISFHNSTRPAGKSLLNPSDTIQLRNVQFKYPNSEEWISKDISLDIAIGKTTAFIGPSGAGKTTLVDIILGLLQPVEGQVCVDCQDIWSDVRSWQKILGYIPQTIYLSDDTIRRNIAFGIEDGCICEDRVWEVLELAQLRTFVESIPEQLNTVVGERGVRLSGGQRQRIGIARALYHNPQILVLDEATSSLDNATEKEIMKAIDNLRGEKTIIIISHRMTTVENADIIFKLVNGQCLPADH